MAAQQEQELNIIRGLLARLEHHPVVEVPKGPEIAPELKSYVEKVEEGAELAQPTIVNVNGVKAVPPQPQPKPSIVLPLTPTQFASGLKASVADSVRWLAVWCLRLLKIYGQRAVFRAEANL